MSDWDPFDDTLAGELRRRAGSVGGDQAGTDAAHRRVLARSAAVRRRRATVAGGGALVVLLVGGLALLAGTDADQVADLPDSELPDTAWSGSPPATTPAVTRPSVEVSDPAHATSPAPSTDWSDPVTTTATVPTPTGPGTSAPSTAPVTEASPPSSTSVQTGTPPGEYPYTTTGGRIVVGWDGSALSLVSYTAADGYSAEVEDDQPDRIRVRFRGDDGDFRIECRLDGNRLVRVE